MNIRHALEYAEKFLDENRVESAISLINYAENYLRLRDPENNLEVPAICCFFFDGKIIHCGREETEPLFPGNLEERVKLCKECRRFCRKKIRELRERIEALK